ncbi:Transcription factor bHLH70 [Zea mays]|uniref:Transcription factor bHLH70 n=1 Tax=Zea mays TaxID=4577 RepID=A0A3L6DBS8_MAIZE|nr:Transcription factor bHLH70 [Zea mays]
MVRFSFSPSGDGVATTVAIMQQWTDKQQVAASTSAAMAAQMPFLALLQGAGVVVEAETEEEQQQQHEHDGRKRQAFARAVSKLDLLESCLTQAVAPAAAAACAPVASRTTERRRKRPRTRARAAPPPEKRRKPEEAESQRMTHIAVERNRRRLMNDHLASLRSLIPSRYIPRGDQATVVGGAIDYVKQLEQQLVALQAAAGARRGSSAASDDGVFLVSPQYASYSGSHGGGGGLGVDVEATGAVGGHVRVRVAGRRWPGRLVRAVAALEGLRLAVLHLAVTSVGRDAVVCCFNLKMEEGCEVATADEVATVVHQIFTYSAAGACC